MIFAFALSSFVSGKNPLLITISVLCEFALVASEGVATDDVASVGGFDTS